VGGWWWSPFFPSFPPPDIACSFPVKLTCLIPDKQCYMYDIFHQIFFQPKFTRALVHLLVPTEEELK
jgi:hypothetical protein